MLRNTAPIFVGLALLGCSEQQLRGGQAPPSDVAVPSVRMVPWTEVRDARDMLAECRKAFAERARSQEQALRSQRAFRENVLSRFDQIDRSETNEAIIVLKNDEEHNEDFRLVMDKAYKEAYPNCF
jgi:hypothetical protein